MPRALHFPAQSSRLPALRVSLLYIYIHCTAACASNGFELTTASSGLHIAPACSALCLPAAPSCCALLPALDYRLRFTSVFCGMWIPWAFTQTGYPTA